MTTASLDKIVLGFIEFFPKNVVAGLGSKKSVYINRGHRIALIISSLDGEYKTPDFKEIIKRPKDFILHICHDSPTTDGSVIKRVLKDLAKYKLRVSPSKEEYSFIDDITEANMHKITADDMSGNVHKEKEYRITLNSIPPEIDSVDPILIKQGTIKECKNPKGEFCYCRVRFKKEPGKDPEYSLGVKNLTLGQEAETKISKEMFDSFYPDNVTKAQKKKRHKLSNGWEVNLCDDGTIQCEYEFKKNETNKDVKIPEHWDVKEDQSKKYDGK